MAVLRFLLDLVRGGLIGVVETIPGVSGGTVALVVGIYDDLIRSAGHVIRGAASWVRGLVTRSAFSDARAHFAAVAWRVVIPALIGMVVALLLAAKAIAPLVESHPVETRALFSGLILASVLVPVQMVGRWRWRHVIAALGMAVLSFVLTGIPAADPLEPQLWLVAIAAAVAVCALVLPGVSGSFILLVAGLYTPTLAALNDRNLAYIGVFALGAVAGLALFVPALQWLLAERRAMTLAIMAGLMVGSLRALWPWQDTSGGALAPSGDVVTVVGLVLGGIVLVLALIAVEAVAVRRRGARELDAILDAASEDDVSDGVVADGGVTDGAVSDAATGGAATGQIPTR